MKLFILQVSEYSPYSDKETIFSDPLILLGISLALIIIGIIITRAALSIPAFLKYQKMQTLLLIKIARAQGVSQKEIEIITEILEPDPTKIQSETEGKSILKIDKLHEQKEINQ